MITEVLLSSLLKVDATLITDLRASGQGGNLAHQGCCQFDHLHHRVRAQLRCRVLCCVNSAKNCRKVSLGQARFLGIHHQPKLVDLQGR